MDTTQHTSVVPYKSLGLVALHIFIVMEHQDTFHIVLILTLFHVKL